MNLGRFLRSLTHKPTPWKSESPPAAPTLDGPKLAVVIICYKMGQQIGNTLKSLTLPYQLGISANEYEIHLIDNGSPQPLDESVWKVAGNIRYEYVLPEKCSVNPGVAINRAVAKTNSPLLCVLIDGARLATPGVLRWGIDLSSVSTHAMVDVRSWHLGYKSPNDSLAEGYSSQVEKELLQSIGWPDDGYRLFEIGFPSNPTRGPFFKCVFESNCFFMSRLLFDQLGGFDERYQYPGGGLAGVDFFHRAVAQADLIFTLLGEGTFHQTHGGAASGLDRKMLEARLKVWRDEYEMLSRPWNDRHRYETVVAGHTPLPAQRWLQKQSRQK